MRQVLEGNGTVAPQACPQTCFGKIEKKSKSVHTGDSKYFNRPFSSLAEEGTP